MDPHGDRVRLVAGGERSREASAAAGRIMAWLRTRGRGPSLSTRLAGLHGPRRHLLAPGGSLDGMRGGEIDPGRMRRARILAVASSSVLAVGQAGLWLSIEPLATWSYDLSWWSAIFLIDAVTCLRTGSSMILARPRAFLALAFGRLPTGCCTSARTCGSELVLRRHPPRPRDPDLGVFVSFATVLPGVLEVHAALSPGERSLPGAAIRPAPGVRTLLARRGRRVPRPSALVPAGFYPLIWGCGVPLARAVALAGDRALAPRALALRRPRSARAAPARRARLAGHLGELELALASEVDLHGALFERAKLFEMPYLGFVGFVPFALGCHSVARALVVLG